MKRALAVFILALTALTVQAQTSPNTAAPGGEKAYTVTFNRPHAPGETYHLEISLSAHTIGHIGIGQASTGNSSDTLLTLKASVRVLKVDGIGEPIMFLLNVGKAVLKDGKDEIPLGLDGAQIGVTYPQGKPHFVRRDGKKLDRTAGMLLSEMFPKPKGINPDSYQGPGHPVKPGDSWPIDTQTVAKMFKKGEKGGVDPSKISGTVTFKGIEEWEGVPCLHLVAAMTLKEMTMPHFVGNMKTDMSQDTLLPVDPKISKSRQTNEIVNDVFGVMVSEDGKKMNIKGKSRVNIVKAVY